MVLWEPHKSGASQEPQHRRVIESSGLAGYGFVWAARENLGYYSETFHLKVTGFDAEADERFREVREGEGMTGFPDLDEVLPSVPVVPTVLLARKCYLEPEELLFYIELCVEHGIFDSEKWHQFNVLFCPAMREGCKNFGKGKGKTHQATRPATPPRHPKSAGSQPPAEQPAAPARPAGGGELCPESEAGELPPSPDRGGLPGDHRTETHHRTDEAPPPRVPPPRATTDRSGDIPKAPHPGDGDHAGTGAGREAGRGAETGPGGQLQRDEQRERERQRLKERDTERNIEREKQTEKEREKERDKERDSKKLLTCPDLKRQDKTKTPDSGIGDSSAGPEDTAFADTRPEEGGQDEPEPEKHGSEGIEQGSGSPPFDLEQHSKRLYHKIKQKIASWNGSHAKPFVLELSFQQVRLLRSGYSVTEDYRLDTSPGQEGCTDEEILKAAGLMLLQSEHKAVRCQMAWMKACIYGSPDTPPFLHTGRNRDV